MQIHNTMTGKLEKFEPLYPPKVMMYVCGPTVYDHAHIGHARTYVSYDMVFRYLKYKGYKVRYVRNITDIDDKIIHKANQENQTIEEVSHRYTDSFHDDLKRLNLLPPTAEPRATETVSEIIDMIQTLIDKKHAYVSKGDVYFSVKSFKAYGNLSKKNIEDLQAGARVAPEEHKNDPLDFALWKSSKKDEPSWESPWGPGRPGWHIECSAMSKKHLGVSIDIHTGGRDLIFPHHENEIAQSECANGKTFVKYWMHNGFVNLSKEKMSKSLGNTVFLKDLFKKFHPEVLKYHILSSHYRSPIEFSYQDLETASAGLDRMYRILFTVPYRSKVDQSSSFIRHEDYFAKFDAAMDDDFNTPKALAVMFDLVRNINKFLAKKETYEWAVTCRSALYEMGQILGLFSEDPATYFTSLPGMENMDVERIETLIAQRVEARREKNFALGDQIRIDLEKMGITLEDSPEGTSWRKK